LKPFEEIAMPGDFDPRGLDTREREDGIHDREEQWLALGREHDLSSVREEPMDDDARARDGDWRDERDREPRDRDDDR
jgi:hypothetical protein